MYQQPAESRIVDKRTHVPATPSSNFKRPKKNSHFTNNLRIGSIHSANYCLPPPSYSSYLMKSIVQSETKYLSNWCVTVENIKLEHGDTTLIVALSGTLLENDCQTISYEYYDAGRLDFIISKNFVKTNNGVYHLLGPIAQGYPNNLYRACLEADGIPRTWKYVLTQFSAKPPGDNQKTISTSANIATSSSSRGMGVYDLIKKYRILRNLTITADRKSKELYKARKPTSFVRHQFQQKLTQTLKIFNNKIIRELKTILKDE